MAEGITPKIVNLALDPKYGKFSIEPLERLAGCRGRYDRNTA